MIAKQFSIALGEVDDKFITEAMNYQYSKASQRKRLIFKRIAVIAAVFTVILASTLTVSAIRDPFFEMVKTFFDDHVELSFDGEKKYKIEEIYGLTVIPNGFELTDESINSNSVFRDYENKDGNIISSSQMSTGYDTTVHVDTENSNNQTVTVDGMEIYVVKSKRDDVTAAFWGNDGYSFNLVYFGSIDVDALSEMISDIQIIEYVDNTAEGENET